MKRYFYLIRRNLGISFRNIYDLSDDRGRGRFCMLVSSIMTGIVGQLSGGLFYTSFLLMYGLDKSRIGILFFIPYITALLNIFSPYILERFQKRKRILVAAKFTYYFINIVCITLLPTIVTSPRGRLFWFVVLVFIANAVNQLFASGFSAWNANFLPDYIRVDYFSSSSCISTALSFIIALGVSYIGDKLTGTPYEPTVLIAIRYTAFALAVIDCIIWLVPKEYPYTKTVRVKLSNIFTIPIHNKRFLLTILIVAGYNFNINLSSSTINAYLLEDTTISYTLVNGINSVYFLFILVFSKVWKKFIDKHYWFRTAAVAFLMESVTYFAYSFVNADKIWLYIIVRFSQHFTGVVILLCSSSLPYVNLPDDDQTTYLSFYALLNNLSVFLGMMFGTAFTGLMGNHIIPLFAYPFSSTQLLLLFTAIGDVLMALFSLSLVRPLAPPGIK